MFPLQKYGSALAERWRFAGKREKVLLALFLILLCIYLLYTYLFNPWLEHLGALRQELAEVQEDVSLALSRDWDDIVFLQSQIEEISLRLNQLHAAIPRIKDTPGILVDLYELTRGHNLQVPGGVTFKGLERHDGYSVLPLTMKVVGRREDVYAFVSSMENFRRLIGIEEAVFVAGETGVMEASLVLHVYILEEMEPDPEDYPFVDFGEMGVERPYKIFPSSN